MPASETSATLRPASRSGNQPRTGFIGIVLVVGDRALPDPVAFEQHPGHPRILASQHVGCGERFQRPQRDVAEIADRRGHQIERRLERARRNDRLADDETLVCILQRTSGSGCLDFTRFQWHAAPALQSGRTNARAAGRVERKAGVPVGEGPREENP